MAAGGDESRDGQQGGHRSANQVATNNPWLRRRVHTGTRTRGVLAQRVQALHRLA